MITLRIIKMVSNLLHLLWTCHRLNIATITVSLLVILLISTLSVSVAVGESISLNKCTIGGADSYGKQENYRMWKYVKGVHEELPKYAFETAQFFDAGDKFGFLDWNFEQASDSGEDDLVFTMFKFKARACSDCGGGTDDIQFDVTAKRRGYLWDTVHTETLQVPYCTNWTDVTQITLEAQGKGDFAFADGYDEVTFTLKHDDDPVQIQFQHLTIMGQATYNWKNWECNFRGMDFNPGDAAGNFDCIHLAHERSTDYVEFDTTRTGRMTLRAYCKAHEEEPSKVRVKVNDDVVSEVTITYTDTEYWWEDLWTGNLSAGDTIRIENNQWGSGDTFHDSFVSFANDGPGGSAFKIVGAGAQQQLPTDLPPGPTVIINGGASCTGFPEVLVEVCNIPSSATTMKVKNHTGGSWRYLDPIPTEGSDSYDDYFTIDSYGFVQVRFYDDDDELVGSASDRINYQYANADMAQFPTYLTAFPDFSVGVANISEGVRQVGFEYQERPIGEFGWSDWKLYTMTPPLGSNFISFPFVGEPMTEYMFRVRVEDCAGETRSRGCSMSHICSNVKVVPHNLQVDVVAVSPESAKFTVITSNWQAFKMYRLYVSSNASDVASLVGDPVYKLIHGPEYTTPSQNEEVLETVVEDLETGTRYYYCFWTLPMDRQGLVLASGSFILTEDGIEVLPASTAYFPFNGSADDESGNGNDGTAYGATLTEDRFGNPQSAYYFDSNSYIDVGRVGALQSFSVSFWVQPEVYENHRNVFGLGGLSSKSDRFRAEFHEDWLGDKFTAFFGVGHGPENYETVGVQDESYLPVGEWGFVVMTHNHQTDENQLYINGVLIGTVEQEVLLPSPTLTIGVGYSTDSERYFKGKIDDFTIYNGVLPESEIQALYEQR